MERQSRPDLVRRLWICIKKLNAEKKATSLKNIHQCISNDISISIEELEDEIKKAVDDYVLSRCKANTSGRWQFQFPKLQELDETQLSRACDWYCYVCHLGENIIKCGKCFRGLHEICAIEDDEIDNLTHGNANITQSRLDTSTMSIIVDNETKTSNTSRISIESSRRQSLEIQVDDSWLPSIILKKEPMKSERISMDTDEIKPNMPDCEFISVIRSPSKRSKTSNLKAEIDLISNSDNEDTDGIENLPAQDNIYCRRCTLFNGSEKNQPPNINKTEVNYLLRFLYERIKPWINFNASTASMPKDLLKLFTLLFLKFPITLEAIKTNLLNNVYNTLDEFYCDILDFNHCIGIMYGTTSKEYELSVQVKKECNYHIAEIRLCPDCYRHSNDLKNKSKYWFTEPCLIRHELVFAKQNGFSYWPAKVLKLVNNNYDVRFFGGKHERAIVDSKFIKSIDTSLQELKITKKSASFAKAMEELEIYQQRRLSNFNDDFTNIINMQQQINNNCISLPPAETHISHNESRVERPKRNLKSTPSNNLRNNLRNRKKNIESTNGYQNCSMLTATDSITCRTPPILSVCSENTDQINGKSINIDKNCQNAMENIKKSLGGISLVDDTKNLILHTVRQEIDNLQTHFKTLLRTVKKSDWCRVCGKIGNYYCCVNIFYCSIDCQNKHWNEDHANNCKHVESD